MEILEKEIRVRDLSKPYYLRAMGDIHLGSLACDDRAAKKHISDIKKSPNTSVVLMGDLLDLISEDDKRWSPETIAKKYDIGDLGNWGDLMIEAASTLLNPIASKIILSLAGNHETGYEKKHHRHISKKICKELKTNYGGYDCLFTLKFTDGFKSKKYTCRAVHGAGGASTATGRTNRLLHYMRRTLCDLVMVGHMHGNETTERILFKQQGIRKKKIKQYGTVTGCYLDTYISGVTTYGEKAGYKPGEIGHPRIKIIPSTGVTRIDWISG
jgi:UDP-2,3-diacylglucosamine pyrophosphatase LpxH